MNGGYIIITLVIAIAMLAFLLAKLASFLKKFAVKTQSICYEMERADSDEEYRRLRGELRCHYLCLIPFVNKKNVMRVYNRIFHRSAHTEQTERKDSIMSLLMPSILGICLCLICISGMTWAWYSASVQTPAQKMTAANYEVKVEFVKCGNEEIPVENGGYNLEADKTYTVELTAYGSVKECGGYCLIQCGETKLYTQKIMPNDKIIITLPITQAGTYTFTGVWGSHPIDVTSADLLEKHTEDTNANATNAPNAPITDNTFLPAPAPAEQITGEDE